MPRRGWHNEQWAQDWLRILMGPRPPSVRWPAAHQNRRNVPSKRGKFENQKPDIQKPEVAKNQRPKSQDTKKTETPSKVRLTPAETVSKAAAKVTRLEAALAGGFRRCRWCGGHSIEGSVEESSCPSSTVQPRSPSRRVPAVRRPCSPTTRKGQSSCRRNTTVGTVVPRTVGNRACRCGSSAQRSILSPTDGSFRGQFRVEGSPPTGGPIEARTRCVDVDFRRPQAHGRIGNTIRRSFDADVGSDRGWRCKAQMCGEPERNAVIVGEFCSEECAIRIEEGQGWRGFTPGPGAGFVLHLLLELVMRCRWMTMRPSQWLEPRQFQASQRKVGSWGSRSHRFAWSIHHTGPG